MTDGDETLGLYLSVPFCRAKCTFCHFASDAFPPERMAGYVDRLRRETADARSYAERHGLHLPQRIDTVFLGGGTPSLLEPAQIRLLFRTLREHFAIDTDAEITVEAAPGQISDELLAALSEIGVNRISLGVQSFIDEEARAVGRTHTGASCRAELTRLREAGVRDLNVDLIAGLPYQTAATWATSLQQVINANVDHTSVYMLEIDEGSRLGKELIGPGVRYGAHAAPTESQVADLYVQACETLQAAGLHQYEISNFAREGHRSRHNLKYWTRAPYLGFGLDAHSMLHDLSGDAVRFANDKNFDAYLSNEQTDAPECIDRLGSFEETVFLGLRLVDGLSMQTLRQTYPTGWVEHLMRKADAFVQDGLVQRDGNYLKLTQQGRLLSSSVFGELLATEPSRA